MDVQNQGKDAFNGKKKIIGTDAKREILKHLYLQFPKEHFCGQIERRYKI